MRILLTGASGQLGRELQASCPAGFELTAYDIEKLDITREDQVSQALREAVPDLIVNAAAYTAVDRAEQDKELAFRINAEGPRILALAAIEVGVRLIHISTDFVFSGDQAHPYRPDSRTDPQCVYGASKLAGEQHVLQLCNSSGLVIRTAWVYSRFGQNFVKTMLRLMLEPGNVSVVMDQIGTPTWTQSLAEMIWAGCRHPEIHGVYHWTDDGVASWYDFAIAIQEEATSLGLLKTSSEVLPITSADFPTAAHRPPYSVLDTSETRNRLSLEGHHWRRQLGAMLREMKEHGED